MFKHCAILAVLMASVTYVPSGLTQGREASFGRYAPAPQFTEVSSSSFYLPMRDGVKIAMRVDRPARDGKPVHGKFPVIWHGSILAYVDNFGLSRRNGIAEFPDLVRHGYIVVQVARRGLGQSFGVRRGYHDRNEAQDAYEITQWLAQQSWSSGRVGVYGCSNSGDAALHVMSVRPPALKAVFAGCFSWHKYDAFRRGGIFAQWGTGPTRTLEEDMSIRPIDGDEKKVLLREAAEQHQLATSLFDLWKGMPYRDSYSPLVASPFWQEGSAGNYLDQIRRSEAALYIMGSWKDELRDQGAITFLNVPNARLLFGPWLHCMNDDFKLVQEAHRFFDQYLKGVDIGMHSEPRVHYFTVNAAPGQEWRSAPTWPLPETRYERHFLATGGKLTTRASKNKSAPSSFAVKYDTRCPDADKPMSQGAFAQPCHVDDAGVSFAQPSLRKDTELTGHIVADLWVAADAPDANVFAYLEDVAPDGSVHAITEGRLKASLRATHLSPWIMPSNMPWHRSFAEDVAPLELGSPVQLTFDFMPTSYLFKQGHRIQITVTGADPRERARDLSGLAKTISVYADRDHPSSVTLPIIPR